MSLELFNDLSGCLQVEIDAQPRVVGLMEFAPKTARIKSVTWEPQVYLRDAVDGEEPFRDLTEDELNSIVFQCPRITVGGIEHQAPNGVHFTIRDMIGVVCETERQTRGQTNWFGGIDLHHVFFEGIRGGSPQDPGAADWNICWGS